MVAMGMLLIWVGVIARGGIGLVIIGIGGIALGGGHCPGRVLT